jgi:AcrR family transcriptional regulator
MPKSTSTKKSPKAAARRWGIGARVDNPEQGAARILAAAKQCYTESGVASSTIDDIADQAGVSRRTVYRYFDNKEAIILAVVEEQAHPFFEQMREELAELETTDFRQLLIHCALFTVEYGPQIEGHEMLLGRQNFAATAGFYLKSTRMRNTMHELLSDCFHDAQQAGDINPEWQLHDLLNWMGRLIYSFIQHPEPKEKIEQLVTQYLLPNMGSK